MTPNIRTSLFLATAAAIGLAIGACRSQTDQPDPWIPATCCDFQGNLHGSIVVGPSTSFTILLGTVGSGEYHEPTISEDGLTFTGITTPSVYLPSGVQQLFHFKATKTGTYLVTFPHDTGWASQPVVDTVVVR